MTVVIKR